MKICKLNIVQIALTGLLFGGCASMTPIQTSMKVVDIPEINVVASQELGDSLISYVISSTKLSIQIQENFTIMKLLFNPQIPEPISSNGTYGIYRLRSQSTFMDICYDSNDSVFFIKNGYGICDGMSKSMFGSKPVKVAPADYADQNHPQFKQELIYNGRVGFSVKFLYRELSGDYMRPAFTQDIQYDLNEGKIIGFKGARLEVIDSTNRMITYKVLKKFDRN